MTSENDNKSPKATVVHISGSSKLVERLAEILDSDIPGRHGTISSEVTEAANEGIDAIHAILKMPSSKNEKLTAESCQIYADTQKKVAETRMIHAEAERIEMSNDERLIRQKLFKLRLLAIIEEDDKIVHLIDAALGTVKLTNDAD